MFRIASVICLLLISIISINASVAEACTILTAKQDDIVLFGNNEDYTDKNSIIWFYNTPFTDLIDFSHAPYRYMMVGRYIDNGLNHQSIDSQSWQLGINEHGLVIDGNSLESYPMDRHPEKKYSHNGIGLFASILGECKTVDDVIGLIAEIDFSPSMVYQIMVADAFGDAMVFSPGSDGEIKITRKTGDGYLISTNTNREISDEKLRSTDKRYALTAEMLDRYNSEEQLIVENFVSILDRVHVEGVELNTDFSTVIDLKSLEINLSYFHQFEEVVTFNLIDELSMGNHEYVIQDLFSKQIVEDAENEQRMYFLKLYISLSILLISSLALIVYLIIQTRKHIRLNELRGKNKIILIGRKFVIGLFGVLLYIIDFFIITILFIASNDAQLGYIIEFEANIGFPYFIRIISGLSFGMAFYLIVIYFSRRSMEYQLQ